MDVEFRMAGGVENVIVTQYEAEIRDLHAQFTEVTYVHCDIEKHRDSFNVKLQAGNRRSLFAAVQASEDNLQVAIRSAIEKVEKILREKRERGNVSHFRETDESKYKRVKTLTLIEDHANEPDPIDAELLLELERRRLQHSH